jgi:hypothetical protein
MLQNGFVGNDGAGQGYGRQEFPFWAAVLLNDSNILASARAQGGSTFTQHFWVKENRVGFPNVYPNADAYAFNHMTYLPLDVGTADWSWYNPGTDTPGPQENPSNQARYRNWWVGGINGALATLMLKSNGTLNGEMAVMQGAMDPSNIKSAFIAFYDRIITQDKDLVLGGYYELFGRRETFNSRRGLLNTAKWTGRPDFVDGSNTGAVGANWVSSSVAGQIAYDFSFHNASTLPITQYDIRYSTDPDDGVGAMQWVTVEGVPSAGVLSNLSRGIAHEVSLRAVNEAGPGRWSPTWPFAGPLATENPQPGRRNRVVVAGTGANAAPVFAVAPRAFIKSFPLYKGEEFEDAGTEMSEDFMLREPPILYAGSGYRTGWPVPTLSFQWRRNGVAIPGETGRSYTVYPPIDGGSVIDFVVTATNSQGFVTANSQALMMPAEVEPEIPAVAPRVAKLGTTRLARNGGLMNVTNGKQGTIAFKGKIIAPNTTFRSLVVSGLTNRVISFQIGATGNLPELTLRNTANAAILTIKAATGNPVTNATGEVVLVSSWDLEAGVAKLFLNGVDVTAPTGVIIVNDLVNYQTTQNFGVGAETDGAPYFDGELEYVYMDTHFIDLTVPANVAKFNSLSNFGGWGDQITGHRPPIFIWGDADSWNGGSANRGLGGKFVLSGDGVFSDVTA